jgi:hypothetical protein
MHVDVHVDEIGTEGLQFRLEGPFFVKYKMLLDNSFLFKAFQGSLIF